MPARAQLDIPDLLAEYMSLDRQRDVGDLTVRELDRWSQLKLILNLHFQPGLDRRHADRRGSIRVPTRCEVRYESDSTMGECLMTNLSRDGLFIATSNPLPIGTEVELRVFGDDGAEDTGFEVRGVVQSHHAGRDQYGEHLGMGVRFGELDARDRKCLDEFYERTVLGAVGSDAD